MRLLVPRQYIHDLINAAEHPRLSRREDRNLDQHRVSVEQMTYICGILYSKCRIALDGTIFVGNLMTLEPPDQDHQMQYLAAVDLSRSNHHHITRS
jgi:hypothetical protein